MLLDREKGWELDENQRKRFQNELATLQRLFVGMQYLYGSLKEAEDAIETRQDKSRTGFFWASAPSIEGCDNRLVACFFNWYSVSAVSYTELVGWIASQAGFLETTPLTYAEEVIPEVKGWRDSVGAHYARARPGKQDSTVVKLMSVAPPVSLVDHRFHVGVMQMHRFSGGSGGSSGTKLRPWSLTEVHEALAGRYWVAASTGQEDPGNHASTS